jgi:hypothetical protein
MLAVIVAREGAMLVIEIGAGLDLLALALGGVLFGFFVLLLRVLVVAVTLVVVVLREGRPRNDQ